jgi:hypothetical protein
MLFRKINWQESFPLSPPLGTFSLYRRFLTTLFSFSFSFWFRLLLLHVFLLFDGSPSFDTVFGFLLTGQRLLNPRSAPRTSSRRGLDLVFVGTGASREFVLFHFLPADEGCLSELT